VTRETVRDELAHLRDETAAVLETYLARPLLRGTSHAVAVFAAAVAVAVLAVQASASTQLVASIIYGFGLVGSLGTSALYHRVRWRPRAYRWIRKLDHSMIFVLIASSFTPFALLALHGTARVVLLATIWTVALGGVALRMSVDDLPRWLRVSLFLGLGWSALTLLPALQSLSTTAFVMTIIGGMLYTLGGLVYLFRRPDPLPRVFGFHEVFHAFVVAAATCHFLAVWPLVTS
jgi:hemolysin III